MEYRKKRRKKSKKKYDRYYKDKINMLEIGGNKKIYIK